VKSFKAWDEEAVAANAVGSGNIAGAGVGPDGEPGVSKRAQKRHQKKTRGPIMAPLFSRRGTEK
jgi:hypothetical protein